MSVTTADKYCSIMALVCFCHLIFDFEKYVNIPITHESLLPWKLQCIQMKGLSMTNCSLFTFWVIKKHVNVVRLPQLLIPVIVMEICVFATVDTKTGL